MLGRLRQILSAVRSRRSVEDEFEEELRDHIARDTEHRLRKGASPDEARRAALVRFGAIDAVKDELRDEHGITMIDDLGRDVRLAFRRAMRRPQYTMLVVLTIGLGVGAATAVFSAVDGVLLEPLPFPEPDELVTVWQTRPAEGIDRDDFAPATFLDVADRSEMLSEVAAANPYGVSLSTPGRTEHVEAWQVSERFLPMLDIVPHIGRVFEPRDFTSGAEPVMLLGHGFWQQRFGGDPAILGQTLVVDDVSASVIGVMPPGFDLPEAAGIWMPWVMPDDQRTDRFATYVRVFGRLAPGATTQQAQNELVTIAAALERDYPRSNAGVGFTLVPLRDILIGNTRPVLYTLIGAAAMLLIVTMVNVAALHLTRLARGRGETSVRAALGASRRQLIRPLVAEAVVLGVAGGLVGLGLAWAGVRVLHALGPDGLRRLGDIGVDWRAVAAAGAFSVATVAMLSLLPLRRLAAATPGTRTVVGGRLSSRGRHFIVGAQIALGLVLLIGTTLLVRSFMLVLAADKGYRTDDILSFSIWVYDEYPDPAGRYVFVQNVIERLAALPGVQSASMGSALPLADEITGEQADIYPADEAPVPGEESIVRATVVWPSYFETLGIALRRGRAFARTDDGAAARVVVVNESFARRFFPGQDPIGRTMRVGLMGAARERTIVGMVADTRHERLDAPPEPAVFIPWAQQPLASLTFVMRTSVDPASLAPAVTRTMYEMDPQVGIGRLTTLDGLVSLQMKERTFLMTLIGAFAIVAVVIATVGVFGVMSQAAAERTREIAVRMAVGASPRTILGEFLASAGWMTAGGIAAGLVIAFFATRAIAGFLYGVAAVDAASLGLAVAFVVLLALIAAALPSWKAARMNPAKVLQEG